MNLYQYVEDLLKASAGHGNPFYKDGMTEVRCCCNPGKLLGYLPYNGPNPVYSAQIRFRTKDGKVCDEELHCLFYDRKYGYAFKSNDKSINHFRNIEGFVEAK